MTPMLHPLLGGLLIWVSWGSLSFWLKIGLKPCSVCCLKLEPWGLRALSSLGSSHQPPWEQIVPEVSPGPPSLPSFFPLSETFVLPYQTLVAEDGKRSGSDNSGRPGQAESPCSQLVRVDSVKPGSTDWGDKSAVKSRKRVFECQELRSSGQGSCQMIDLDQEIWKQGSAVVSSA